MNFSFILPLIYALIYFLINVQFGLFLLKIFSAGRYQSFSKTAIFASAFMLGQGVVAAILLGLALCGEFKSLIVLGTIIALGIISLPASKDLYLLFKNILSSTMIALKQLSFFWRLLFFLLVILLLFFAAGAVVLPPMGDAEAYYMVLPKIVAGTGKLLPQPNYYEFSKLGFMGEAHYAALMNLANFHAAKFFVWLTVLGVIGFIFSIGAVLKATAKGHLLALAMLLTTTTFTNYITDGKIDVFGAAFGLGAFYWALKSRKGEVITLALTGLFLGFAVVAKLSNILAVLPGVTMIVIWNCFSIMRQNQKNWFWFSGEVLKSFGLIFLFLFLAVVPHLIKNKVLFNDPLAISNKYENFQWTNPVWSAQSAATPSFTPPPTSEQAATPPTTPPAVSEQPIISVVPPPTNLALPVASLLPERPKNALATLVMAQMASFFKQIGLFIDKIYAGFLKFTSYPLAFFFGDRGGQGGNLSILILGFLPFLLFGRWSREQKQIGTIFLVTLTIWVAVRAAAITPRYILPLIVVFLPLLAARTETMLEIKNSGVLKFLIRLGLIVVVLIMIVSTLFYAGKFVRIILGKTRPSVLYGPYAPPLEFTNKIATKNDRVFLVGYYGFFLRSDLLSRLDNEEEKMAIIFYGVPSPWAYIYSHGFKYVIVQKAPHLSVVDVLESQRPIWLNIKKIYSDPLTDIFSIDRKQAF